MQYIDFKVQHQTITRTDNYEVVGNSENYLYARFEFCAEWDDIIPTAVFSANNGKHISVLIENGECLVPWEMLRVPEFWVGVFGGDRQTTDTARVAVKPGVKFNAKPGVEPTPTAYEKLMNELRDGITQMEEHAENVEGNAEEAAASAEDAAASAAIAENSAATADSAKDVVLNALNNVPAGSTVIVNDLTTGGTAAALSAEMGKVLSRRPNPNLLHNWYFGNPVDQRGGYVAILGADIYTAPADPSAFIGNSDTYVAVTLMSGYSREWYQGTYKGVLRYFHTSQVVRGYVGAVYGIDRWRVESNTQLAVLSDCVRLTGKNQISQFFEKPVTGEVTVSLLFKNHSGASLRILTNNGTTPVLRAESAEISGLVSATFDAGSMTELLIGFRDYGDNAADLIAAKLELGSTQTLAHKDPSGNWVLNEIPDYGEELRKCQRYYIKMPHAFSTGFVSSSSTKYHMPVSLPVSMRATPAASMSKYTARKPDGGYSSRTGSGGAIPASLSVYYSNTAHTGVVDLCDSLDASAGDTNNMILHYIIDGLELSADL